jgi:NADH-quinone oxidoreductase subunit J
VSPAILAGLPAAPLPGQLGTGETVLFWVVAPVLVLAALGLLFAKKAVHAALLLALVMIGLAVLYAAQGAPFLFAAQIVVYTGAVMMLFLFVLMLVGVDASDSLVETIRGQRLPAVLAGAGTAFFLVAMVTGFTWGPFDIQVPPTSAPVGMEQANADGNPVAVARVVFADFALAFELTGALLITAALGAILMTHRERLAPRMTQRALAERRVREGRQVTPLPTPGVFARHNGVDIPALLPDGSPSELSVSRVLRARGQEAAPARFSGDVAVIQAELTTDRRKGVTGSQFPDDRAADGTLAVSDAGAEPADGALTEGQAPARDTRADGKQGDGKQGDGDGGEPR